MRFKSKRSPVRGRSVEDQSLGDIHSFFSLIRGVTFVLQCADVIPHFPACRMHVFCFSILATSNLDNIAIPCGSNLTAVEEVGVLLRRQQFYLSDDFTRVKSAYYPDRNPAKRMLLRPTFAARPAHLRNDRLLNLGELFFSGASSPSASPRRQEKMPDSAFHR